jgi:hypothetical protein
MSWDHGQPSNSQDVSLQWEESRVDAAYVASNGPCRIAAVGKEYGRSIAVAAARGVCVLDLSRIPRLEPPEGSAPASGALLSRSPRWKVFGSVNDEQGFSVVSMLWFERSKEDSSEDLLLAVVQYASLDTLHLACWSRKRCVARANPPRAPCDPFAETKLRIIDAALALEKINC